MYVTVQPMNGQCPCCHASLGVVPVTAINTANTAPALQSLRGFGHLVVRAGQSWLVRCATDAQNRLSPAPGVGPEDLGRGPAASASAATQPQGGRRNRG